MIIGSEFNNAKINSEWMETGLLINYKEMKIKQQYYFENQCISFIARNKRELPADIWYGNAKVVIVNKNGYIPEVRFFTNKYLLRIFCEYQKGEVMLEYKLLYKKSDMRI